MDGKYLGPSRKDAGTFDSEAQEYDFRSRRSQTIERPSDQGPVVRFNKKHKASSEGSGLSSLLFCKNQRSRNSFRLIKRSNPYGFNIHNINLPFGRIYGDLYHTLLDQTWWKIFAIVGAFWVAMHFVFGCLYYLDISGIDNERDTPLGFADCFFLSVQTMETIGYGRLNPLSIYVNIVACIEAYVGVVMWATFSGLIFAKVARPSRQKRYIVFSEVAAINSQERWWEGSADAVDAGRYRYGGCPCLVFRFANIRKSQLCDTGFHLLLVRKEKAQISDLDSDVSFSDWSGDGTGDLGEQLTDLKKAANRKTSKKAKFEYRIHELNFDINNQEGRVRGNDLPTPLLPLPWTVIHPLDDKSPLKGCTPESLKESHAEIIAVFDGLYEGSATSVQARFSYTHKEIVWNAKFVPMVRENARRGCLEADYSKLSDVVLLDDEKEDVAPSIYVKDTTPSGSIN